MAVKAIEIAVGKLTEEVNKLVIKVTSLDKKIAEQNEIISSQSQVMKTQMEDILRLKTIIEGNVQSLSTTQPSPAPALQRVVRKAHLDASAALSKMGKATTKKTSSVKAALLKVTAATQVTSQAAVTTEQDETVLPNHNEQEKLSKMINSASSSRGSSDDNICDENNIPLVVETYDWKTVKHKRHSKRKVLTGAGGVDNELQTIQQMKYIQTWALKPETTVDNIRKYINKLSPCADYYIEKRNIKTDRHAAFVIGCPASLFEKLSSPSSWPPGVKLSEWWFRASPRSERGDRPAACSAAAAGCSDAES